MNLFTKLIFTGCATLLFSVLAMGPSKAQNFPIDFESNGNGANWNWTTFENDSNPTLEIVTNPDISGINTSQTVAKFTALQAGQPFAGCESLHAAGTGTFTIDSSNMIIRIMVWKNTISDVGIKLVRVDNWSLGEIKIANTLVGEWEQIEFDFSAHIGNTYDQVVIFPDFTARTSDQIIYFDNVFGDTATSVISTNTIEAPALSTVQVFPNPNRGVFTVKSPNLIGGQLVLSDILGRTVLTQTINSDQTNLQMPAASEQGLYLLRVLDAQGQLVESKKLSYLK